MRALVVLCVLLALGWGLRAVTRTPGEGPPDTPADKTVQPGTESLPQPDRMQQGAETASRDKASIPVQVTFSAPAKRAELRHLGKVVWSAEAPSAAQKFVLQLPFPPEGIELAARVEWVGSRPGALRIQLTAPDGTELDRTAWGEAVLETILPFP